MLDETIVCTEQLRDGASMTSLVEVLRARALELPARVAYTFLLDGETKSVELTYGELERRARTIAVQLEMQGARGQRVLLLYPPGLEYIAAFWGCLYAGGVAVPAYPPRMKRNLQRLQAIVADSEATCALTTAATLARMKPLLTQTPGLEDVRWIVTDETTGDIARGLAAAWRMPNLNRESLAFLQYTSGSTSTPKGVMVTHGNLLHNEAMIQRAFRQTADSVIVGWLPLYHDMGLIGNVLQPLFIGARCVLMSPVAFLQRPLRWLQAISRYRATTSGAPNFAYDLCTRKITADERATLDLGTWSVAFNGSEPVRAETLHSFAAAFESCGFRPSAFYPCYGLAEATLFVSGSLEPRPPLVETFATSALEQNRVVEADADDPDARLLVACGSASAGQHILIVNADTLAPCAAGEVGEIWVAGESVAAGYWRRREETQRTFDARLPEMEDLSFLRTGDLGFLHQSELFVTGRLKDLIIIRGRNLYPQDIERSVEASHAELRAGCGAAFSVEAGGEERLVVVQEAERNATDYPAMLTRIRQAVAEEHEAQLYAVVLVKVGSVPKTSSGKIQHRASREMFLSNNFEPLAEWRESRTHQSDATRPTSLAMPQGAAEIEDWLRAQLAAQTGVEAISIDISRPITHYGIDSLATVELMHAIETTLGIVVPFTNFYRSPSIGEIAREAARRLSQQGASPGESAAASMASASDAEPPATNLGASTLYPLSYGQQAMLFLYRMSPENTAYNVPVAVRLRAAIDAEALRAAFQTLVERHAALRTTFILQDGVPVQRVHDRTTVSFEEQDATRWDDALVKERLSEQAARPFDLDQGPLLRVYLMQRGPDDFLLEVVTHHIVSDFWSLTILLGELDALYAALQNGAADATTATVAALAPLEAQYTDYVRWQARALEGAEGERLWNFWRKELAGELPVLNLLTDRPRAAAQSNRGAAHTFALSGELTDRLKELSRRADTTLYMTLLAAFNVLLARYTGQSEIIVGSPTAGRSRAAHAHTVGYFVNLLPLRSDLSGNPRFSELLGRVRSTVLDAFAHQDYPFPLIVQRLQPGREASQTPLFQTMFVMQQTHTLARQGLNAFALGVEGAQANLRALTLESVALEQRAAQFDLTLAVAANDDRLLASLEYNTELFDASTIELMSRHFAELLTSITADAEQRIAALPLLSGDELEKLLRLWNATERDYDTSSASMLSLFDAQAKRTPDAPALSCGARRLSYRELDAHANRLAHHLRERGLGVEQVAAVLLDRTPDLLITLLAVLKTGAAYLPLDPAYPAPRLRLMLEDSQASLLITTGELAVLLDRIETETLRLDAEGERIARRPVEAVEDVGLHADNLAYLIYTSGSTGRPKAVAITHRSAQTLLYWAGEVFTREELAGVLASTSVCFDLSVFELFAPLSWGGEVILATNALELATMEGRERVRLVNTVPSAMNELVRLRGVPQGVVAVNLAGEALSRSLVEDIYNETSSKRVINLYGPSEDTTYSTWTQVPRNTNDVPTIGRPIANTQVYILDPHMRLVPVGVAGELYIAGDGLARGYLSRPALTAERFLPNPFSPSGGERLYRTGDFTRWLPAGEIEFLGRMDHQVKVRGFRIELGEVEAVIRRHAAIRECIVVVSAEAGDRRLVAYTVAEAEAAVSSSELRSYLKERLPEYMLPSVFVSLDAMPLTPSGKVDRRALPALDGARPELDNNFVAPRNETERGLCEIWGEVIGIERVGINDNFFELGGHSLLATTIASRIHQNFQIEIPLRALFEAPTVAELALVVEQSKEQNAVSLAPRITPLSRESLRRSRATLSTAGASK